MSAHSVPGSAMPTYFKAVRPDGTDFYSGTVQWAPPEGHEGEWVVRHPTATEIGTTAREHLSVSTEPTSCAGQRWPCRLIAVEAVGDVEPSGDIPNKMAGLAFRVVRELAPHVALGPQGEQVAALIDRLGRLTDAEAGRLYAAWAADWDPDWAAAWDAAWAAAGAAVWAAARDAAWDPVLGLLVRDLISSEHYNTLTRPWASVIGKVHPDD